MVSYLVKLAALAATLPAVFAVPTTPPHLKIRNPTERNVKADSYIVVYADWVNSTQAESHISSIAPALAKRDSKGVGEQWDFKNLHGYQVTADAATIAEIANSPEIAYIEKDGIVSASALTSQSGSTYGLGRISHRNQDSTTYIYDTTAGQGVTVFVIDTGILTSHSEFGGRAVWGANFVDSSNTDGNGHGTHCAGTVGGRTYGVAKNARLVAVKVLGSTGQGTNSGVISGLNWIGQNAPARSVVSMSLGGVFSSTTNSAVRSLYNQGITVVVAAGNNGRDASGYSPASESTAITVGAIDANDNRATFSNFGSFIDIFAPGVSVLSSWIGSTSATRSISGTSMAAPHVAGVAAYLIALEGLSTPASVASRIIGLATTGKVVSAGTNSPNRILYNGNGA